MKLAPPENYLPYGILCSCVRLLTRLNGTLNKEMGTSPQKNRGRHQMEDGSKC